MKRMTQLANCTILLMIFGASGCSDDDSESSDDTEDSDDADSDDESADDDSDDADSDDGDSDDDTDSDEDGTDADAGDSDDDDSDDETSSGCEAFGEGLQIDRFIDGSLVTDITEEDCTLTNGDETTCFRIEIIGEPTNHDIGPFCPTNISDGDDVGGTWIEDGELYDLDGAFFEDLATFYNDDEWQLFDPDTGEIFVTAAGECMDGIDGTTTHVCVECSIEDDVTGGAPVVAEFLIPAVPVARDTPEDLGTTTPGVAINGVIFEAPAPVDLIKSIYTIAAFDDCGGHVNPQEGYHYHASLDCPADEDECDGHSPLVGYAQDGYAINAMTDEDGNEPDDLDDCRGHSDDIRGYHYHAASPGENMFIGCFSGERAVVEGETSGPMGPPPGR